jgi:hypothetical protein
MIKTITSSQLPPTPSASSESTESSQSTEGLITNIKNASRLPGSQIDIDISSTPPDVSLEEDDVEKKMPRTHLHQFKQMMKVDGLVDESSDEDYDPEIGGGDERRTEESNGEGITSESPSAFGKKANSFNRDRNRNFF